MVEREGGVVDLIYPKYGYVKEVVFSLPGKYAALLVGVMVTYIAYPFRDHADAEMRRQLGLDTIDEVESTIGAQWKTALRSAGLDSAQHWASPIHADRVQLTVSFCLSERQIATAILAVRASIREFEGRWTEFLAAGPGGLHM